MKQTFYWMMCAVSYAAQGQSVLVQPTTVVTVNGVQTIPNLKNNGSVVVGDKTTLTLMGTASGTGMLSVTATTSLIATTGTLYFNPSKNTIKNLYVQGTLTLGNTLNITAGIYPGTVKIRGGTLFSDSFLTLKSDLWGTARIDSSSGNILGLVNVERYIPPNRAWRFLTVPFLISPQSINQAWQEGYTNTTLACPAQYPGTVGFGTHLTYKGLNGYDLNTTQNSSLYLFEHNHWVVPVSTLTKKITDYFAYAVFVRGDRTICLSQATSAIPVPTTLRASGLVSVGAVTHLHTASIGEYVLEGNPYVSSIDVLPMTMRSSSIVPETFWVWDPGYGDNGGYVAYSYGVSTPMTTHYPAAASVRTVQSGQGYMVQATDSGQQLKYEEADKVATQSSLVFGRPIRSSVVHVQLRSEGEVIDGVAIRLLEQGMDTVHRTLGKLWKFTGEGMALIRNNTPYAIETRRLAQTDTFFVGFRNIKSREYTLEVFQSSGLSIYLRDRLLQKDISIVDTVRYRFVAIPSDSSSFVNRFVLTYDVVDTTRIQMSVRVYPNPVRTILTVSGVRGPLYIQITDIVGRVYMTGTSTHINCEALRSGLYFVTINGETFRFEKL